MELLTVNDINESASPGNSPQRHYSNKIDERYLHSPTLKFIDDYIRKQNRSNSQNFTTQTIAVLVLSKLQLSSVGDVSQYHYLQILDLSCNFIASIEKLSNCTFLVKLDLHSNRIASLPDGYFWQSLTKLKILYLHDNLLSSYDDVKNLSSSPSLEVLTMHDTPLSLKKNYRHHVVNSIWSLKALDQFILADDEIIEKTHFPEPYTAFSIPFKLNLYIVTGKNSSIRDELNTIQSLISKINYTQSHYCPVLILQKNFRTWIQQKQLLNKLLAQGRYTPTDGNNKNRRITLHMDHLINDSTNDKLPMYFDHVHSPSEFGTKARANTRQTKTTTSKYSISKNKYSDDLVSEQDTSSPGILQGQKSQLTVYEPIEELNDEIRVARAYVQSIKDNSHQRKKKAEIRDIPMHRQSKIDTFDDRLLRTLHGSMAFGCLVAIDKAYADRNKIEQKKLNAEQIEQTRTEQNFINSQLKHLNQDRLQSIHRSKNHERIHQTYIRRKMENSQSQLHDHVQEQRRQLYEQQQKRRQMIAFSVALNSQHISISNALQKHERNVKNEIDKQKKSDFVQVQRDHNQVQTALIEKYLQQRTYVRRALSNIERKNLDIQTMKDASDRLAIAQQRVAKIRARESNIQQFSLVRFQNNDDLRRKTQSLTESMLERESLFDTMVDRIKPLEA
ncbi:unnamed protein product [Didymodactylos carnosus]|uniref:Leucine-rich repeat and IQ domain-containing protein 3 n=1 Tax=Didymodactylos carnosus TaxID=1234261 RepID=A0A814EM98_9BILA|nr:unnamed protein product [Didymodactylos carnosus]CAF0969206.1 unnamed protein product [Didymodactylos carnosus]CAF3565877.1 unnamed protein product [Didymodactylos carnosus]CAF3742382.1 unnamed protein product [Didymodactylos carnosus]